MKNSYKLALITVLSVMGILSTADNTYAQSVNDLTSFELNDSDTDGWAEIGESIDVRFVVDGLTRNGTSDDTLTVVEFDFTKYGLGKTRLTNSKNNTGSNGDGTGSNVEFSFQPTINSAFNYEVNALNGVATNVDSAKIPVLVYLRDSQTTGSGDTLLTTSVELSNAPEGIDNWRPRTAVGDTIGFTNNAGLATYAGVGDDFTFTVPSDTKIGADTLVDNTISEVYVRLDGSQYDQTNFDQADYQQGGVDGFNFGSFVPLSKNNGSFSGSATLIEGSIDDTTGFDSNYRYFLVDEAGNIGVDVAGNIGSYQFEKTNGNDVSFFVDNTVSDLDFNDGNIDDGVELQFAIADPTTDGLNINKGNKGGSLGEAVIIGTRVQFAYSVAGDTARASSISMDLSNFGSDNSAASYDPQNDQFERTITTAAFDTDDNLGNIDIPLEITDKAGNVINSVASFDDDGNNNKPVDLIAPGTPSISLTLDESNTSTSNSVGNPSESINLVISDLNDDDYYVYANNSDLNSSYNAEASNVALSNFPTDGTIIGPQPQRTTSGSIDDSLSIDSFTLDSNEGLDIASGDQAGEITFYVRDDAGNEVAVNSTMPFAVDNIVPAPLSTSTLTLSNDADGNGIANIGDELTVTLSDAAQSDISAIYAKVKSTEFGNQGQQKFENIGITDTTLGDVDGDGKPDYIEVQESSATLLLYDDQDSNFLGLDENEGQLEIEYIVVDNAGNVITGPYPTTEALPEAVDTQVPDTQPSNDNRIVEAANIPDSTVSIGEDLQLTFSDDAGDISSVTADLSAYGGSSSQQIPAQGQDFSYTFPTTEQPNTPEATITDRFNGPAGVRISITAVDESGNSSSGFVQLFSNGTEIDLVSPDPIAASDFTITHIDDDEDGFDDPSDGNGVINQGEDVRIVVDAGNNPDFANGGQLRVDLSAIGGASNFSMTYDADNKVFENTITASDAPEVAAGEGALVVRNVIDNAGNELNPSDNPNNYISVTIDQAIDTRGPQISGTPTFGFSSNTDQNGDGIAAVGDDIQVVAQVSNANTVQLDARFIGLGFIDMTNTSGDTWEVEATVAEALQPYSEFASDSDQFDTRLRIVASDNSGNTSNSNTALLPVDNIGTKKPNVFVDQNAEGQFRLDIENGDDRETRFGSLAFGSDMFGGSVSGVSLYKVFTDSASGTIDFTSPMAEIGYAVGTTTTTTYTTGEFTDGANVQFAIVPVDDSGNPGDTSSVVSNIADDAITNAEFIEPNDSSVVGSNNIDLRVQVGQDIVNGNVAFKARAADTDPVAAGDQPGPWEAIGTQSASSEIESLNINASVLENSTTTPPDEAVDYRYEVIAVLTDENGNTQTDAEALANNGFITLFADSYSPEVEIVSIDGENYEGLGTDDVVNADVSGETEFTYKITDQFPVNPRLGNISVSIDFNTIANGSIAEHVNNGLLSVNDDEYTFTVDMTPYTNNGTERIRISVSDGRGNPTTTTSFQQFTVLDDIAPNYSVIEPGANTYFSESINVNLDSNTEIDPLASGFTNVRWELSTNSDDFTNALDLGYDNSGQLEIDEDVRSLLTSGQTYYLQAVLSDSDGNEQSTSNVVPIIYDNTFPTFDLSFENSITIEGTEYISGDNNTISVTSPDDDLASVRIHEKKPNSTNTFFVGSDNSASDGFELTLNTLTNFNNYEGPIQLLVDIEDEAGNRYDDQIVTVNVDNHGPQVELLSVNGDTSIESLDPVQAGTDTLTMSISANTLDGSSPATEIVLDMSYNSNIGNNIRVEGVREGDVFTFAVPLPANDQNQTYTFNSGDFTVSDTLGNTGSINKINSVGDLYVAGSASGTAQFAYLSDGMTLGGNNVDLKAVTAGSIDQISLQQRKAGNTEFANLDTVFSAPFEFNNFNTSSLRDGDYEFRLLAELPDQTEIYSDTVQVIIDNTFDTATERAVIADLNGATLGGEQLTLFADAPTDVSSVRFYARFMDDSPVAGFQLIGTSENRNPDGSFSVTTTPDSIATAYGATVTINDLQEDHELVAIAMDDANMQYTEARGLSHTFNSQYAGNLDDLDDVQNMTTTTVNFDFTAPSGELVVDGNANPNSDVLLNYDSQDVKTMNLLENSRDLEIQLSEEVDDFAHAVVTIQRYENNGVGNSTGTHKQSANAVTVERITDPANIVYTLSNSEFEQDGVYKVEIELVDALGNRATTLEYDFVNGAPRAWISGFSAQNKMLRIAGSPHAQSAKVEYSIDGGNSFTLVDIVDLNIYNNNVDGLDATISDRVSLSGLDIPAGTLDIRVIASERQANEFVDSRFDSSPTILSLDVEDSNGNAVNKLVDQRDNVMIYDDSQAWTPANSGSLALIIGRGFGELSGFKVEVAPSNRNDYVVLTETIDNNLNSDRNTIQTELFPRERFATTDNDVLDWVDGNHLSVVDTSSGSQKSFNASSIDDGGLARYTATAVLPNGTVEMAEQQIKVFNVAANRGGTIASADGNFSLELPSGLQRSVGVLVESDPNKFLSANMAQMDWAQIGNAYYLKAGQSNVLRDGYPATIQFGYEDSEITDVDGDGVVTGKDEMKLSVGLVSAGNNDYNTNFNMLNKSVDTVNNVVSFQIRNLPTTASRYTLILPGGKVDNPGTMEVVTSYVGVMAEQNNIVNDSLTNLTAIITDPVSQLDPSNSRLYVNGALMEEGGLNFISISSETYKFTKSNMQSEFELEAGVHTARMVVPNGNGNLLVHDMSFYIENDKPKIHSITENIGHNPELQFLMVDPQTSDTLSGINPETVFIDVYANVPTDSGTTVPEFIQRFTPDAITLSGESDSLMANVQVSLDKNLGDVGSITALVGNFEALEIDINGGQTDEAGSGANPLDEAYNSSNGISDMAGNSTTVKQYRFTLDTTAPTAEVVGNKVESGIRVRATDEGSGIDPESILIDVIPSEGEATQLTVNDDNVTYTADNNTITITDLPVGASVDLIVADNAANDTQISLTTESTTLTVGDFHVYPNPYNPNDGVGPAKVAFTLSQSATVNIAGYDFNGREAIDIANEKSMEAGSHEIDFFGDTQNGSKLANGVYFLRITVKNGNQTENAIFKVVVAKE